MGESDNSSVNNEVKSIDLSKVEAGAILGLAAYGGVSLVKGAIRKFKSWNLNRAQKKIAQINAQQPQQPQQAAPQQPQQAAQTPPPATN